MRAALWIAAGSAIGGVARYGLDTAFLHAETIAFPWSTLLVNTAGSLLIGFIAAWSASEWGGRGLLPRQWQPFATSGLCGGFTTFSTFSTESLELLERSWPLGAANVAATVLICLLAVTIGYAAGTRLMVR